MPAALGSSPDDAMSVVDYLDLGYEFYASFFTTIVILSVPLLVYDYWYNHVVKEDDEGEVHHDDPAGSSTALTHAGHEKKPAKASVGCKIVPNPMLLLRGAEYGRFTTANNKLALTPYDMSLTAKDQQAMFCYESDYGGDQALESAHNAMIVAWKEPSSARRIEIANQALQISENCASAHILLAEESAQTVEAAEVILKRAVKAAEISLRRSRPHFFQDAANEFWIRPETRPFVYARRRHAMCLRKLGRQKEAAKMFRELLVAYPAVTRSHLNVQSNLLECLLDMGCYADGQKTLDKYEALMEKSAVLFYTTALLRAYEVCVVGNFAPDTATDKGLTNEEVAAIDALHKAIEFNPHVPKYLLEMKSVVLPPEHVVLRGDSEAVAYAFDHLIHWQRCRGALQLLQLTWEGSFRLVPRALHKGLRFEPYPDAMEVTDRKLLPAHHKVSVYPEREVPVLVIGTACLAMAVTLVVFYAYRYPALQRILAGYWGTLKSHRRLADAMPATGMPATTPVPPM